MRARHRGKIRDVSRTAMRSCLRELCRSLEWEKIMLRRGSIRGVRRSSALCATISGAAAVEDAKYPDFRGQWHRVSVPRWVQAGQKAPLTPEYQKVFDANLADMAGGGQGNVPSWYCLPQGMPMMMNAYDPVEFVVTPDVTYILISHVNNSYRRVYHGRTQLVRGDRAHLCGLFDRQMGRREWRRPLRHAGNRNPQHQDSPRLRCQRPALPRGRRRRS